jgi:pimeloyl-ACP methyl ester carboxylesterase
MKTLKRILIIAGISIILLLLGTTIYIYTSGPVLPEETDEIIEKVITNPLPELITGESGFAQSQGMNIWYERIQPEGSFKGTILLIMGISNDGLGWPESFIRAFVNSGYQVIRYDHRGTGMSDWVKNWDHQNPYSLSDMAADAVSILESTGTEKANIIGVSMGGMIAQQLAIDHPEKINSLTVMMSSGFIEDPDLPSISSEIAWELIKVSLKYGLVGGEKNMIKLHLASRIILMGEASYGLNIKEIAQQVLYNIRERNGYNHKVSRQHQEAVRQSGSRYPYLRTLDIPTLVIHGKSDPFIPVEHGIKCVSLIPYAESFWVDNMGHDIPEYLADTLAVKIIAHLTRN